MIKFTLTKEEAEGVLRIIAQLPTSSNAYPLYNKMMTQYQSSQESKDISAAEAKMITMNSSIITDEQN